MIHTSCLGRPAARSLARLASLVLIACFLTVAACTGGTTPDCDAEMCSILAADGGDAGPGDAAGSTADP
jgi:hypothetical protein